MEAELKSRYDERERANILFMLFQHFLEFDRADLVLNFHEIVPEEKLEVIADARKRLMDGEPIQYITGYVEFHNIGLEVGRGVLIPRPETEELVQLIIDNEKPESILDIGTGSGCIAIALANAFPEAKIQATDVSNEALQIATRNMKLNSVLVKFSEHDVLSQPLADLGTFDLIVSNPPYVGEEERSELAQHVIDHEPHLALFANSEDPLMFYRKIATRAKEALNDGGKLYFELNAKYARMTAELLENEGCIDVSIMNDLQGKERFLKAAFQA